MKIYLLNLSRINNKNVFIDKFLSIVNKKTDLQKLRKKINIENLSEYKRSNKNF